MQRKERKELYVYFEFLSFFLSLLSLSFPIRNGMKCALRPFYCHLSFYFYIYSSLVLFFFFFRSGGISSFESNRLPSIDKRNGKRKKNTKIALCEIHSFLLLFLFLFSSFFWYYCICLFSFFSFLFPNGVLRFQMPFVFVLFLCFWILGYLGYVSKLGLDIT